MNVLMFFGSLSLLKTNHKNTGTELYTVNTLEKSIFFVLIKKGLLQCTSCFYILFKNFAVENKHTVDKTLHAFQTTLFGG
jgi:hypothetical protein